jgi:hypothetical protein
MSFTFHQPRSTGMLGPHSELDTACVGWSARSPESISVRAHEDEVMGGGGVV